MLALDSSVLGEERVPAAERKYWVVSGLAPDSQPKTSGAFSPP
jgi:hypothetical protein